MGQALGWLQNSPHFIVSALSAARLRRDFKLLDIGATKYAQAVAHFDHKLQLTRWKGSKREHTGNSVSCFCPPLTRSCLDTHTIIVCMLRLLAVRNDASKEPILFHRWMLHSLEYQ